MSRWVQGTLLGIVLGLVAVFTVAVVLDPFVKDEGGNYVLDADGKKVALRQGTHQRMGLPPCSFYYLTGYKYPCPSCGMTTSFTLLMHGDLWDSLKANYAGTALAVFCLALIPWSLVSVWRRKAVFVRSLDRAMMCVIVGFLVLTLSRWVVALAWIWWSSRGT